MSANTANKRLAAMDMGYAPWLLDLPLPGDGTDAFDLAMLLGGYGDLVATVPTFIGPDIVSILLLVDVAMSARDYSGRFNHPVDTLTFALHAGTLPTGLSLSSAGILSGTPTETGTFAGLVIRATDDSSDTVDSNAWSITVVSSLDEGAFHRVANPGGMLVR